MILFLKNVNLLLWKVEQFTLDNGKMNNEMDGVGKFGQINQYMKVNGLMIKLVVEAN